MTLPVDPTSAPQHGDDMAQDPSHDPLAMLDFDVDPVSDNDMLHLWYATIQALEFLGLDDMKSELRMAFPWYDAFETDAGAYYNSVDLSNYAALLKQIDLYEEVVRLATKLILGWSALAGARAPKFWVFLPCHMGFAFLVYEDDKNLPTLTVLP